MLRTKWWITNVLSITLNVLNVNGMTLIGGNCTVIWYLIILSIQKCFTWAWNVMKEFGKCQIRIFFGVFEESQEECTMAQHSIWHRARCVATNSWISQMSCRAFFGKSRRLKDTLQGTDKSYTCCSITKRPNLKCKKETFESIENR